MKRVCNQIQAPSYNQAALGDLQWADPPNLLQLQQLVWPQPWGSVSTDPDRNINNNRKLQSA